jgi:hypothetical protein
MKFENVFNLCIELPWEIIAMSQQTYTWTLRCKNHNEAEGVVTLLENLTTQLSLKTTIIQENIVVLSKRTLYGWYEVISTNELRSINKALSARMPVFE